ncbi:MAG: radical SAM family heme chaperone HemW [Oscillatoriaceae cyanobacterium Prado104]|jgi:oxygen-independent coproporphyrinogen-3 oxidase|nr:radical SAM family heme chaperone HemW [Oscillatoriaceae cyanobacterium Prado104]
MRVTKNDLIFEFNNRAQVTNFDIPSSAYLHVPFCRRRCYYCDFPVFVVGDRKHGENSGTIVQYIAVLCDEIEATPNLGLSLKTVFFGGGTPSLLSVSQLSQVLDALDKKFGIATGAEISIEIDPGTFTLAQLQGYAQAGVNRFSLGVQAFQDELLQGSGRSHSVADIFEAVEIIRSAGIVNFSLDLISGLPHQTLAQWETSLRSAVQLEPAHLSCYDLIVEPVTPFGRYFQAGVQPLPADETAAQMYRVAREILVASGYEHYEISNYARHGYQCRHNRVYWENRAYYGMGMGAASYVGGKRFTRPRKTQEYYRWVRSLPHFTNSIIEGKNPQDAAPPIDRSWQISESKVLLENSKQNFQISQNDVLLDTLMLGFRLAEGLSVSILINQFGQQTVDRIWRCLQPYWRRGWVEIARSDGSIAPLQDGETLAISGNLRFSDPEGFLFSNQILAHLFSELEIDS